MKRSNTSERCRTASRMGGGSSRTLIGLLLVALASACQQNSGPLVVITVAGLTSDTLSVRATATLNSQTDTELFTNGLSSFGLRLPSGASGTLSVALDALRADQCAIARGSGSVSIDGQSRADLDVMLTALATPDCSAGNPDGGTSPYVITALKGSGGDGLITSTPAGISCGATCSAGFSQGAVVKLTVAPDAVSLFTGWSGACTSTVGSCTIAVNGMVGVTANFAPKMCSSGRFCLEIANPPAVTFRGVWGASSSDVWAVGSGGKIMRWDGVAWTNVPSGTTDDLFSVWGSAANDVWIGGINGTLLRWNGSTLSNTQLGGGTPTLAGIWGSAANDVWIMEGAGSVFRWNGTTYTSVATGATQALFGIWGSGPNDVWLVGVGGAVRHFTGSSFVGESSGTTMNLNAVSGTAANDVWAVGLNGTVIHWTGSSFSSVSSGSSDLLLTTWALASNDAWAAGTAGTVLRWNGSQWNRINSGTSVFLYGTWSGGGNDAWVVGEMGVLRRYEP